VKITFQVCLVYPSSDGDLAFATVATDLSGDDANELCRLYNGQRQRDDAKYVVLRDETLVTESEIN
jgi:hypothetical protein